MLFLFFKEEFFREARYVNVCMPAKFICMFHELCIEL
jgi:hypothetical protein